MGPWEACFGAELDWEKLWRDQVFGAKMTETNGYQPMEEKPDLRIGVGGRGGSP